MLGSHKSPNKQLHELGEYLKRLADQQRSQVINGIDAGNWDSRKNTGAQTIPRSVWAGDFFILQFQNWLKDSAPLIGEVHTFLGRQGHGSLQLFQAQNVDQVPCHPGGRKGSSLGTARDRLRTRIIPLKKTPFSGFAIRIA